MSISVFFDGRVSEGRPPILILALLMAWLPLPFGSFRSWSWNIAGIVIGGCLVSGVCRHSIYSVRWSLYVFLGVVAWSFAQILPLWVDAEGVRLAVAPFRSLDHTLRLIALGAFWMCGFSLSFADPVSARRLSHILAHVGAVWVFFSLLMYGFFPHYVLFWEKVAYVDVLTGPFINRNAAACFLGIVALLVVAQGSDHSHVSLWYRCYFWCAAMAAFVAILLTESRGGFLAFLVGCGVFFYLYKKNIFLKWYTWPIAVCLTLLFGKPLMGRFLNLDLTHILIAHIFGP